MFNGIRRRDFISALGGAIVTWPIGAGAQDDRIKRIGLLMSGNKSDPKAGSGLPTFIDALAKLQLRPDRDFTIIQFWSSDPQVRAANLREIINQKPDVIVLMGEDLRIASELTTTVPLVFVILSDTDAHQYIASFARPGGNITGFASDENSLLETRLGLLREMSPAVARVLYVTGRNVGPERNDLSERSLKDAAAAGIGLTQDATDNIADIEAALTDFAQKSDGGLIVAFSTFTALHREQIVALASRYSLPAIYPLRTFSDGGGLFSYGVDLDDQLRKAASYADRILKGAKAGDLPVQLPTRYDMTINVKAADAIGLKVPATLIARANEVIG